MVGLHTFYLPENFHLDISDNSTFLNIPYPVWGVIGSIAVPLLIVIVGWGTSWYRKSRKRVRHTEEIIQNLKYYLTTVKDYVDKQTEGYIRFCRSILSQKSFPSESMNGYNITNDFSSTFNKSEIYSTLAYNIKGNSLELFKCADKIFREFAHIEGVQKQSVEIYREYADKLERDREQWNNNFKILRDYLQPMMMDKNGEDYRFLELANIEQHFTDLQKTNGLKEMVNKFIRPLIVHFNSQLHRFPQHMFCTTCLSYLGQLIYTYQHFEHTKKQCFVYINSNKRRMKYSSKNLSKIVDQLGEMKPKGWLAQS